MQKWQKHSFTQALGIFESKPYEENEKCQALSENLI